MEDEIINVNFDFGEDVSEDDDWEWLDKLRELADLHKYDEPIIYEILPEKVDALNKYCETLSKAISGKGLKIKAYIDKSFVDFGVIEVTGLEICIINAQLFNEVYNAASNFEISPTLNGVVEMNFGFYNMARKVKGN